MPFAFMLVYSTTSFLPEVFMIEGIALSGSSSWLAWTTGWLIAVVMFVLQGFLISWRPESGTDRVMVIEGGVAVLTVWLTVPRVSPRTAGGLERGDVLEVVSAPHRATTESAISSTVIVFLFIRIPFLVRIFCCRRWLAQAQAGASSKYNSTTH